MSVDAPSTGSRVDLLAAFPADLAARGETVEFACVSGERLSLFHRDLLWVEYKPMLLKAQYGRVNVEIRGRLLRDLYREIVGRATPQVAESTDPIAIYEEREGVVTKIAWSFV